jgi:predicted transcriptional regulator
MIKNYKDYLNEIPEDFELLLNALGHKTRINLLLLLMDNESLSLSKITKTMNQENSLTLNHIKKLELAGIVQNYLKRSKNTNEYSFYKLTNFGRKITSNLISNYNEYFKNIQGKILSPRSGYQEDIPVEFELALKAISNKVRYALTLLLIHKSPISFSEATDILKKENSSVINHLKILETGGIIQNYLEKRENTNEYSYYKITNYGEKFVLGLLNSYNDYYKDLNKSKTEYRILEKRNEEVKMRYFEMGCSSWALPNEKIFGWIEIFSEEIHLLKLEITENLVLSNFFNINQTIKENTKEIILDTSEVNLNYIPFEFFSNIPEGDNSVNIESISITAIDDRQNHILKKELNIDILKPIVNIQVKNNYITPNRGRFEINITISKDIQVNILGIETKVLDNLGKEIEIKKEEKDPLDLDQEIPPEMKLDSLTGELLINRQGIFHFHFRVPYLDANNTKYYSNIEIVTLDLEDIELNLKCDYNFTSQLALV